MSSRHSRRRREASRTPNEAPVTQQPHQASPPLPTQPPHAHSSVPEAPDLSSLDLGEAVPIEKTRVRLKLRLVVKGKVAASQSQSQLPPLAPQPRSAQDDGHERADLQGGEGAQGEVDEEDTLLKPGTICISTFIREHDIAAMPSLEAPLTRKRRRGSGEVLGAGIGLATRTRKGEVKEGKAEVEMEGNTGKRGRKKVVVNGTSSSSQHPMQELTNGVSNGTSPPKTTSKPNDIQNGDDTNKKQPKPKDKETKPSQRKMEEDREKLERNIDNVIFGDVTFKAWYPSWYPAQIIGEKALDGKGAGITVRELYVCRRCFGYSKVLVEWVRHCRCCEREVPGRRIYTHGAEEGEEGGWSVWEVDGGVETLFCQNLSLFAKLFLDNKSVFFDVSGFKYFLLVHTFPTTHEPQIIGFFSKEKMSWDNNNLACILIFPPWQRKGLGALLMGVSYAIAKREGIMGGPEKPISDLGKKGYRRYWGAEIARWLLGVKETDRKKGKGMVDVERVSKETWIAPDDCLSVLREMGVVEKAGRGKGTVERVRVDKQRVREWVVREKLSLDRVVDEGGFVEGYALKEEEVEEEEEAEEEEEEEEGED